MKPHADLQVLLLGDLGGLQPAAHGWAVGGERLLHEDVDALVDGVFELHRAEGGVCGQQHHVARPQAVDRLLVGVEAHELPLGRHVDLVLESFCVNRLHGCSAAEARTGRPWRAA